MDVALRGGISPGDFDLFDDFLGRPALGRAGHAARVEAGPELPSLLVLFVPPGEKLRKTLLLLMDRPVELRRQIVAPAVLKPQARVGVQLREGVQSGNP